MKSKNKGFTLIELMVVVAILGVLVSIAVPTYMNITGKSKLSTCLYNLRNLQSAVYQYNTINNTESTEGMNYEEVIGLLNLNSPSFKSEPKCPSNGQYIFSEGEFSCEKHGDIQTPVNPDDSNIDVGDNVGSLSQAIIEKVIDDFGSDGYDSFKKFLASIGIDKNYGFNEELRKLIAQINGGKFDSININDKDYYIQPMFNAPYTADSIFYYANTNTNINTGNPWQVEYIYDKDSGSWYKYIGNGSYSGAGKTWQDIKNDMQVNPNNWQPAPDFDYNPFD